MEINPNAGKPATTAMLVNVAKNSLLLFMQKNLIH